MENKLTTQTYRYTIEEPINEKELITLRDDESIKVIQTSSDLYPSSWEMINRILLKNRADITLRLFGFYGKMCDVSQLLHLPDVRRLSIDSIRSAINIEAISELKLVENLTIGIYDLESFDFLKNVNSELVELNLQETKSIRLDISVVKRFTKLKCLRIGGHTKGIETINHLKSLKTLYLNSISTPDLSFIEKCIFRQRNATCTVI